MLRIRFETGNNTDRLITIPGASQLTHIRIVPGIIDAVVPGTWVSINESTPFLIFVPLVLGGEVFGYPYDRNIAACHGCAVTECDQYPGEQNIIIGIGPAARPAGDDVEAGAPALEHLISYLGG